MSTADLSSFLKFLQKSLENNITPASKGAKEDEPTFSVNNAPKDNDTSKTLSTAGVVSKQAVATNAANEAADSLPERGVDADRKVSYEYNILYVRNILLIFSFRFYIYRSPKKKRVKRHHHRLPLL